MTTMPNPVHDHNQSHDPSQNTESDALERTTSRTVYRPNVEIVENDDEIRLTAEMPGVDESGVEVTLDKNILTLKGTTEPIQPEGFDLAWREYGVGDYERAFTISDEVDRDAIMASVSDGVLTLRLPKSKEARSRKIEIKAG